MSELLYGWKQLIFMIINIIIIIIENNAIQMYITL